MLSHLQQVVALPCYTYKRRWDIKYLKPRQKNVKCVNVLQNKTIIIDQYRNFKQALFISDVSSKVWNGNTVSNAKQDQLRLWHKTMWRPNLLGATGVWTFLEALCKVCQEEGTCVAISQGGKQSKQFTTMNLQNHLRKHPKKFLELAANDKEQTTDRDEYWRLQMNTDVAF